MCDYPAGLYQQVKEVCQERAKAGKSYTSLDIKTTLRERFPDQSHWTQHYVGTACREIFKSGHIPGYETVKSQAGDWLIYQPRATTGKSITTGWLRRFIRWVTGRK